MVLRLSSLFCIESKALKSDVGDPLRRDRCPHERPLFVWNLVALKALDAFWLIRLGYRFLVALAIAHMAYALLSDPLAAMAMAIARTR